MFCRHLAIGRQWDRRAPRCVTMPHETLAIADMIFIGNTLPRSTTIAESRQASSQPQCATT